MTPIAWSFRTRVLVLVLTVAVVPMVLVGLWLTHSASRSGEELLHSRLEEALDATVRRIGGNWLWMRSDLLDLAEDDGVQRRLLSTRVPPPDTAPPASLLARFKQLDASVTATTVRDLSGREVWALARNDAADGAPKELTSALRVELPIQQRFPGRDLGTLEVLLGLGALLGDAGIATPVAGAVLGVSDANRHVPLLPLPFDPALLEQRRFSWGGDDWLTVRRRMSEPPLVLTVAAPLSAFAGPFEDAARRGTWLLAAVALAGLAAAWLLSLRLTRSLERLVSAAEAVSHGDLDAQIDATGGDEVGRVAHAFNTMTSSLRRTLEELARKERLAAVGEFAASLAHEVRNPLTAIRIDLQRVEERLPPDSPLRAPQSRALKEIARLDATVAETLDVASSQRWGPALVDLRIPVEAAAAAAGPAFAERHAILDLRGLDRPLPPVPGDARALEQLFLNLLLNAAAALGPGRRAWIELEEEPGYAVVSVRDSGTGIAPEMLDRVFQPLYTTRPDGTGLGLTIARRIVEQHGGTIEIESEVGQGATVRIRLPAKPGTEGIIATPFT